MARMLGFLSGKQRVIFGGGESSLTLSRGAVSAAAERVAGLRRSAGNLSAKIPPKDVFRVWRRETGVCEFAAAMALDVLPVNQGGGNLFFKGGDVFRISVAAESGDCFVLRRNTAGGWDARWLHGRGADIFDFLRYCFSCDFSFAVKYLSLIRRALADAACGRARGKLWRREAAFSFYAGCSGLKPQTRILSGLFWRASQCRAGDVDGFAAAAMSATRLQGGEEILARVLDFLGEDLRAEMVALSDWRAFREWGGKVARRLAGGGGAAHAAEFRVLWQVWWGCLSPVGSGGGRYRYHGWHRIDGRRRGRRFGMAAELAARAGCCKKTVRDALESLWLSGLCDIAGDEITLLAAGGEARLTKNIAAALNQFADLVRGWAADKMERALRRLGAFRVRRRMERFAKWRPPNLPALAF